MFCRSLSRLLLGLCVALSVPTVANAAVPESWREDAALRAICRLGQARAWAVGDHGTVLRTIDGGLRWELCPVPDDVSLQAVCFLTGKVGWVAGGGTTPFTAQETGVVYATRDGGESWKRVNQSPLPRIQALRFFSPEKGIAAGAATPFCPSGVFRTADGGESWTPYDLGSVSFVPDWRDAAFPSPAGGMVVGYRGRRAVVGDDQLLPSRGMGQAGYRNLNAVVADGPLRGWAAGDGGLILSTEDGGLIWQSAADTLPREVRERFDFQTIAATGKHVWAAGNPGGVIWHSNDLGRNWHAQSTGVPLPIHALAFQSEKEGIAVGALGLILRTSDGGATWEAIRGSERRAGMMIVSPHPAEISMSVLATLSGDRGYRSVTILPVRHDLAAGGIEDPGLARRTHDAVITAGGNAALTDWPLPIAIPGIARNQEALVSDWNRRTEGRLEEVLLGRLVAAIRTWRPDIVLIEVDEKANACSDLIRQASQLAVTQAADATRFVGRQPALAPWSVKKLYVRTTDSERAAATIQSSELLTRLGESAGDLAERAASRLGEPRTTDAAAQYRLVPIDGGITDKPFFAGLALAPDSPARRPVEAPRDDPEARKLVNRQQMLRGMTTEILDDPRQAAGLLAQIEEMSQGLESDQAARQLLRLGNAHRARFRWDLAEEMYVSLVRRYPQEPASRDAAKWLLRLWTGAEPVWRRMQALGAITTESTPSVASLAGRIERAKAMAAEGIPAITPEETAAAGLNPDAPIVSSQRESLDLGGGRTWENQTVLGWQKRAVQLLEIIHQTDPMLFASDEVQSTLALLARTGQPEIKAGIRKITAEDSAIMPAALIRGAPIDGATESTGEAQSCLTAATPPRLDAEFSDPCWQAAGGLTLQGGATSTLPEGGLAMLAHDDRFMYVAISLPRVGGRPVPQIQMGGRTHDADTQDFDRVVLRFDRDLDGVTAFQFTIDERGQTADECWEDTSWDPKWYVAVAGDETRWRIECAIPHEALGPIPPRPREIWGVTIGRIVPAIGAQGWPGASVVADPTVNPGRIRFE